MLGKLLYLVGVLALVLACSSGVTSEEMEDAAGSVQVETTKVEPDVAEPVQVEAVETVEPSGGGNEGGEVIRESSRVPYHLFDVTATLEERIVKSSIIARVRLDSVEPVGVRIAEEYDPFDEASGRYTGSLELTLDVLEYLKGTGGSEIKAVAYGWMGWNYESAAATEVEAVELGRRLLDERDKRWDDREAIVLLRHNEAEGDYYLGWVPGFTVRSVRWKAWLPGASDLTTRTSSGKQRFLLDAPAGGSSRLRTSSGEPASSIALDDLKAQIASLDREYNGGDGSAEYKACVVAKYEWESRSRQEIERDGGKPVRAVYRHEMRSGEAAGTWVDSRFRQGERNSVPDPTISGWYWTEGRDAGLIVGVWPVVLATSRPLPGGEYRVFELGRAYEHVPCDAYPEGSAAAVRAYSDCHCSYWDAG